MRIVRSSSNIVPKEENEKKTAYFLFISLFMNEKEKTDK